MSSSTPRLRPTRAGIVNLWDYTIETFSFAGGRLVLRGSNGSGKTKALEVLFPFVLDGRLDPRRLDPFSGENRTMKENLLWRGVDTNHGYAWLEFGDGVRYVTVGVGLRAQRHQAAATAWFFVADGRVGDDIVLVDPDGRPRTKAAMTEALPDGAVVERARDHRRRVDDTLFGLGVERFEAMLDLVLTLRRPMLAKDLDPQLLSETLARGLRPLDDELIEQVARSFDDLDAVQRDLERLIGAEDASRQFLIDYRGYLRTQARHRADSAIEAATAVRAAEARLATANTSLDEARAAEAIAEAELAAVRDRLGVDRARKDALRASDAFRTHGQLQHLERAVRDHEAAAARADAALTTAEAALAHAEGERDQADADLAAVDSAIAHVTPQLARSAQQAGVEWSSTDDDDATGVRQRVGGRHAARTADVDAVRASLAAVDAADRARTHAEEAAGRAEAALAAASERHAASEAATTDERRQLALEVQTWAADHDAVLDAGDADAVLGAVDHFGDSISSGRRADSISSGRRADSISSGRRADDGVRAPAEVWHDRLDPRRAVALAEQARLEAVAAAQRDQELALEDRRQAILDEHDDAPPSLPWRGRRDERAGAPLWRLVRFADGLDPRDAAGLEAALEAAGLLDAWVTPGGDVAGGALDAFLVASGDEAASSGARTLAAVLVPEDHEDVPTSVVARVLSSVRIDDVDDAASVGVDGRYRLGPLAGAHTVAQPRYIGATARAAHRAARVDALDAELAALRTEADGVTRQLAVAERWLTDAAAATDALPRPTRLADSLRARDRAVGELRHARAALDAARALAEEARREVNDRRAALQREAHARALPNAAAALAEVAAALERFVADGRELAAALDRRADRRHAAEGAAQRVEAAISARAEQEAEVHARRRELDARSMELATLRDRMGADVDAVLTELAAVETGIDAGEDDERRLQRASHDAAATRGQAEGEVTASAANVDAVSAVARDADRRLAVLRRPDLAGPLGLVIGDEATPSLLDAIDALVTGVSATEERRKGAQTRVISKLEELDHVLGSGYRPGWDVDDDLIVVTVADDLGVRTMSAFAESLAAERAEQEVLLTARERALFEDTLLTSVCGQLHGRIQATRDLVVDMDAEMRARRLSSGQTVGVAWRADDSATPEWKAIHRLLDQDPRHFGPDQIDTIRRHFAAEIKSARAADPQTPYRELLARVLDYRSWRRFELTLVEADGREALLTRARHARLSGGEKAASLHLPLFAAAHAAFAGARSTCPRLLALDEAFAGIDDQGRAELLSLTVAFDLDLFMTGFDLWAVDRSVPAVAHYDLLHLVDDRAVSSLLVLWNGRELVEGPDAELQLAALAGR